MTMMNRMTHALDRTAESSRRKFLETIQPVNVVMILK